MASDVTKDQNRLLLEIGRIRKNLNKEIIDPMIPKLKIEDLTPVLKLVAQIHGGLLKGTFRYFGHGDRQHAVTRPDTTVAWFSHCL